MKKTGGAALVTAVEDSVFPTPPPAALVFGQPLLPPGKLEPMLSGTRLAISPWNARPSAPDVELHA